MQTKSQQYSAIVFTDLEITVRENTPELLKKYRTLSKKAGGMLRTVGLIPFLTFLKAKAAKEPQHYLLLENLFKEMKRLKNTSKKDTDAFIEEARAAELPEYMMLTSNILSLLQWHKRMSEILITTNDLEI